jgi:hypothetical protein
MSPARKTEAWETRFAELLAREQREEALVVLEARATGHAGTAKAADKQAAARVILRQLAPDEKGLWSWTRALAAAESPTRRELACLLLPELYPAHHKDVETLMIALADDAHWEVRLWAGSLFERLLAAYFDALYPKYERWRAHASPFVRVAIATSVMAKEQRGHGERAERLLDLIEPLLGDEAHEVARNLGPFAVGAGLLRLFPKETLRRVRRWARSDDEQVRWNVAMVFVAAEARKHIDIGLELLSELARDPRRKVQQAAGSALRNLAKGEPDRVVPAVRGWLKDERKLAASLGLRGQAK